MSIRTTWPVSLALLFLVACNDEAERESPDVGTDVVSLDDVSVDGANDADAITIDDVRIVACDKEDELSPNHGAADATQVEGSLDAESLYVCANTDDWFRVDARAGQAISARIEFAHRIGDLDLYLLPEGTDSLDAAVAESATEEDVEELSFVAPSDGTWFVRVHSFEGAVGVYDLAIGLSCRGPSDCEDGTICSFVEQRCVRDDEPICGDDRHEPNDHVGAATPVELGSDGFAYLHGLKVCDVDDDYFLLELTEPATIDIELAFQLGIDLDLYVFSTEGTLIDAAASDAGNPELLSRPFSAPGTYVLVVDYFVTDIGNDVEYNLTISVQPGACETNLDCGTGTRQLCRDGSCVAFQPDEPGDAGDTCDDDGDCGGELQCYEGRAGIDDNFCTTACGGDGDCGMFDDGYCLNLGRSGVCFDRCDTDAQCPNFYSCGDSGRCELVECRLDTDCAEGQLCRRSEQQNAGFCTAAPFAGCRDDDAHEPNDTIGGATPIDGNRVEDLKICDGNDDWFAVEVTEPGTRLEVSARFDSAADLDVFVFDASGRTVGAGTSENGNPEVARASYLAVGTYYVRVNQFPGAVDYATGYSLAISTSREACTVAGEECLGLEPLRIVCDEDSGGVCSFLEGDGTVASGSSCDSSDDCADEDAFCWAFEGARSGRNICTIRCRESAECADVPGTQCQVFGRGFGACLPPEG